MPEIEPANPQSVEEIKMLIKKHGLNPGSESYSRKLLVEGLEHIQHRIEYNKQLKEAGGISVDVEYSSGWVHNLVRDTLGGQIECATQRIYWVLNGQRIEFDPDSGEVEHAK